MNFEDAQAKLRPIFEELETGLSKNQLLIVAGLARWLYRQGYADRWTTNPEDPDQVQARELYDELIRLL